MQVFSPRVYQAMNVCVYLAFHGNSNAPVSGAMIAAQYGLKKRTFEPVLHALTQHKIVRAVRGKAGGYYIAAPESITLHKIASIFAENDFPTLEAFEEFMPAFYQELTFGMKTWENFLKTCTLDKICDVVRVTGVLKKTPQILDYCI